MLRHIDIHELDVPKTDLECWERYPKQKWLYDRTRVLDAQHVPWTPVKSITLNTPIDTMYLDVDFKPGTVYVSELGHPLIAEVVIVKGEIKHTSFIDNGTYIEPIGSISLKVAAFVSIYFHKFNGVVTFHLSGNNIMSAQLKPYDISVLLSNSETSKLLKKIYKRNDITINGPTDQVLHESFAS